MATSLKNEYADEILEALAQSLNIKKAAGPALEAYKNELNDPHPDKKVKDENDLRRVWNNHLDALNQEESTNEALQLQASKARELKIPGYATPAAAADDKKEDEKPCPMPSEDPEKPEPMAWDGQTLAAAKFAMKKLTKLADALDGKGFNQVANIVDEAIQKLAKKE